MSVAHLPVASPQALLPTSSAAGSGCSAAGATPEQARSSGSRSAPRNCLAWLRSGCVLTPGWSRSSCLPSRYGPRSEPSVLPPLHRCKQRSSPQESRLGSPPRLPRRLARLLSLRSQHANRPGRAGRLRKWRRLSATPSAWRGLNWGRRHRPGAGRHAAASGCAVRRPRQHHLPPPTPHRRCELPSAAPRGGGRARCRRHLEWLL